MNKLSVFFLLLFFNSQHLRAQHVDTALYMIVPYNSSSEDLRQLFPLKSINVSPSENQIAKAEHLIRLCIAKHNREQSTLFEKLKSKHPYIKSEHFVIDLNKYRRQYVGVVTPKGEKILWVNFFCEYRNWKKEKTVSLVRDGGNCFFNIIINITRNIYFDFFVNGDV